MIQYNWVINAVEYAPSENGLEKVIKTVHWSYAATEGDISVNTYGAQAMGEPSEAEYTPYEEVTKEHIISWLEASLPVEDLQKSLAELMENTKNPPIVVDSEKFQ